MGLLRGMARTAAVAGTATAVSHRVSRRQSNRSAAKNEQQAYETQQPAQAQPAPPPQEDDQITQLKQMAALRDQGILNDAEFEAKKKQILGI